MRQPQGRDEVTRRLELFGLPRHLVLGLGLLALVAALVGTPGPAAGQARFKFAEAPGSLSKWVRPQVYRLTLSLDPAQDEFGGQVEIDLVLDQPMASLQLHARELQAARVVLRPANSAGPERQLALSPASFEQGWRLRPADGQVIEAGRHTLRVDYAGRVNRSGVGLFRAEHRVEGETRQMLATQFQAIDARSVFPGFDEPAFRARFELTVRAPPGFQVLANMPLVEQHEAGATTVHRFAPTPPMPSYLLAMAVGQFDVLAGEADGVPLRIFTAPGKRAQASYAMEVSQQVLPWLSRYFGQPYVLPKLDQLAVPSVRSGAMEDWGLISYSETELLFDPARSSPAAQQAVFNTIAHELAHQWFGNLVTAASWEEIWLNEAFATWLADKLTAQFNPAWQMPLQQRLPLDLTMARDAGSATRAIRSGRVAEAQVNDVFDNITYTKGGAVLGMLEQWLGEEVFRRGLASYLRERQYSNATAGDLWHHLAQASGRDVAAVARSWTDRPGLPRVQVDTHCLQRPGGAVTRVSLQQRRLSDSGAGAGPSAPDSTFPAWQIPLKVARGDTRLGLLFTRQQHTLDLPGCTAEPVLVNAGGVAYLRVDHSPANRRALRAGLAGLDAIDQVWFFSDQWALAQQGRLPASEWLALLAVLPELRGPARSSLWAQAVQGLRWMDKALSGTPGQTELRMLTHRLLAPELERLGWEEQAEEDAAQRKLRAELIEQLATSRHLPTVMQALQRFQAASSGGDPLPPSIRGAVMKVVGQHGDAGSFDHLLQALGQAQGEDERWLLATALASSPEGARADRLLRRALRGDLPANVALALPGLVSEHSPHAERAYAFVLTHWPALAELAGQAVWGRQWLLPEAAAGFNTEAQARRLRRDQARLAGADGAVPAARVAASIGLRACFQAREASRLRPAMAALARP